MGTKKSKIIEEKPEENQGEQSKVDLTVLTYSQIRHICQQTNLIDKEVCRRHDAFLILVKDGKMHREIFIDVIQKIWPNGNSFRFANYLFDYFDLNHRGYIDSTTFILLTYQLNDGKSYLGYLFDMFDTQRKKFISEKNISALCSALFELIGHDEDISSSQHIGDRQIAHLYRLIEQNTDKRLYREQFINLGQCRWSDDENGNGILLIEQSC